MLRGKLSGLSLSPLTVATSIQAIIATFNEALAKSTLINDHDRHICSYLKHTLFAINAEVMVHS